MGQHTSFPQAVIGYDRAAAPVGTPPGHESVVIDSATCHHMKEVGGCWE